MVGGPLDAFVTSILVLGDRPVEVSAFDDLHQKLASLSADFEVVVVSDPDSQSSLQDLQLLLDQGNHANVQIITLARQIDSDLALLVGIERSLGDYIFCFPDGNWSLVADSLFESARAGLDASFVCFDQGSVEGFFNRLFVWFYERLEGVKLAPGPIGGILLSRRVSNLVLQQAEPSLALRHLPGYLTQNVSHATLSATHRHGSHRSRFVHRARRAVRILFSTTTAPLRVATYMSLLGAVLSLIYGAYGLISSIAAPEVEPGWTSLTLMQAATFFFLSVTLLVLSEYVLSGKEVRAKPFLVTAEYSSSTLNRKRKLNVEFVDNIGTPRDAD